MLYNLYIKTFYEVDFILGLLSVNSTVLFRYHLFIRLRSISFYIYFVFLIYYVCYIPWIFGPRLGTFYR